MRRRKASTPHTHMPPHPHAAHTPKIRVTVTWFGNFAGCALFLGLMLAAGMFEGKEAYTLLLAQKVRYVESREQRAV